MSEPQISHSLQGSKGEYVLDRDGHRAVLTYSKLSDALVIADHTDVPEALSGTGAGLVLVERFVADARAQGFKIVPLCPFVNAMRRKHPEWADAFNV